MDTTYTHFWDWFIQNKELFEQIGITEHSIKLIDQKINDLGNFAWEIGPGQKKTLSLTISPGGDLQLLAITKKIISQAPVLKNWEFHYAKPIKEWENYFEVFVNEEKIGIDVSNWEYILFRNDDDTYDIQIKPDNIPAVIKTKENEVYGIVEMVLDSIIGEEKRLKKIKDLEVVTAFGKDIIKHKILLINLLDHLNSKE